METAAKVKHSTHPTSGWVNKDIKQMSGYVIKARQDAMIEKIKGIAIAGFFLFVLAVVGGIESGAILIP